jgi:hypothetical protein
MLQKLRRRLKKIPVLHNTYMRLKRMYTGELPGMTTRSEQQYFENYGANIYTGKGEVVDLGCWLGSTTISVVKGLLKNPAFADSDKKVFAYDAFIWYESMNEPVAGTSLVGKYKEGDSFLEAYKKMTAKYASRIEIRAGDLTQIGWNGSSDGNIEFLLVDAMKNWELTNAILRDFYPHLIPGESLVLQQDFAHYFTVWIHLLHWRLRDYFEFAADIPNSSSVVFRNTKKIPGELLQKEYSFADFSDEDVEAAIDYSLSFVSEDKKANIRAAKVMNFIHQERSSDAQKSLENIGDQGTAFKDDLLIVRSMIKPENK